MKKELAGLPYLMCSGAEIVPDYDGKFEDALGDDYRRLIIRDIDIGILGDDDPFYSVRELKPGAVINKPFAQCRQDQYFDVINQLYGYLQKELKKTDKYTDEEMLGITAKSEMYKSLYIQQHVDGRASRRYKCILELLDTWFNTTDNTYIDDYMNCMKKTKDCEEELEKKKKELKKELDKEFPQSKKKSGETENEQEIQQVNDLESEYNEFIMVYNDCSDSFKTFLIDINGEKKEWIDNLDVLDKASSSVNDNLEELKKEANNFKKLADKYNKQAFKPFQDKINDLIDAFDALSTAITSYNTKKHSTINEDSYMLCRCGGIIRIVSSGNDYKMTRDNLQINIVKTLRHAENFIANTILKVRQKYGIPEGMEIKEMDKKIRAELSKKEKTLDFFQEQADWLGAIGGLRVVQKILKYFGEESEQEEYKDVDVPAAKLRFSVESLADVADTEHELGAIQGVASTGAALVGHPEVALFFDAMSILSNASKRNWDEEINIKEKSTGEKIKDTVGTTTSVGADVVAGITTFAKLVTGRLRAVGEVAEVAANFVGYTWAAALISSNLSFQSYNTDSYRIVMDVITYATKYSFQEKFSVDGKQISIETIDVIHMQNEFNDLSELSFEEVEIEYCLYGKKGAYSDIMPFEEFVNMEVKEDD